MSYAEFDKRHANHGEPKLPCGVPGCVFHYLPGRYQELAERRRNRAEDIAREASRRGLDTTPERVLRRLREWEDWYQGRLATGYLMRMTGVRFRQSRKETS